MRKLIICYLLILNYIAIYSNNCLNDNEFLIQSTFENNSNTISYSDSTINDSLFNNLPKNSIYIELLGSAWAGSINYERCLFAKSNYAINGRVGLFAYPSVYPGWFVFIPILVNYQFNIKKVTSFEIGAGQLFIPGLHLNEYNVNLIGNFGLRLIIRKNFLIKINFTPQLFYFNKKYYFIKDQNFIPWGGVSFGYSFGK